MSVDRHGWVWYPNDVSPGWRPYSYGRWVYTEDYGWTWISDWEWGWGPFHYGRWYLDDIYGWVWMPGTEWAPAWVMWRSGGGYIGWAPMPPAVIIPRHGGRIHAGIYVSWWSFVPGPRFASARINRVILAPAQNVTILSKTTNITQYNIVNNRVVNKSISRQTVEKVSGKKIVARRAVEANRIVSPGGHIQRDRVNLYRPGISRGPANLAPPRSAITSSPPPRMLRRSEEERRTGPRTAQPPEPKTQGSRKIEEPRTRTIPGEPQRPTPEGSRKIEEQRTRPIPGEQERPDLPPSPQKEKPNLGESPRREKSAPRRADPSRRAPSGDAPRGRRIPR